MRIYKPITALIIFAAFAYAQDDEQTEDDDGVDEDDADEPVEERIDVSKDWETLLEDETFISWQEEVQAADTELYEQYWAYIEDIVSIVDAAVDAQEIYNTDFYDLEDFFTSLDDEALEDISSQLTIAQEAINDFLLGIEDNEDLQNALTSLIEMWELGSPDSYSEMFVSTDANATVSAAFDSILALVWDLENMQFVDSVDVDTALTEIEALFGLDDVQAAIHASFIEILAAWNAVKADYADMAQAVEDSVDGIVTEYDLLVDDKSHETSQKLIDIVNDIIAAQEESETIEGAKSELEGYLETVNTWINDENWDTVLEEVSNEVQDAYSVLTEDLEEGLPERVYPWAEAEEVPDSAFNFAASIATLVTSITVLSF